MMAHDRCGNCGYLKADHVFANPDGWLSGDPEVRICPSRVFGVTAPPLDRPALWRCVCGALNEYPPGGCANCGRVGKTTEFIEPSSVGAP